MNREFFFLCSELFKVVAQSLGALLILVGAFVAVVITIEINTRQQKEGFDNSTVMYLVSLGFAVIGGLLLILK